MMEVCCSNLALDNAPFVSILSVASPQDMKLSMATFDCQRVTSNNPSFLRTIAGYRWFPAQLGNFNS